MTVSGTPDTKEAVPGGQATSEATSGEKPSGEPSSGSERKPQVKRMPKRPAAKLMPRRLQITKTTAKVPGKNRFKNQETKRCEKAKWEEIKKTAREERAQLLRFQLVEEICQFEAFSTLFQAEERQWKSSQSTGSRKFRTTQSGFSRYPRRLVLAASVVGRGI